MKKLKHKKIYITLISLAVVLVTGVSTAYSMLNSISPTTHNTFSGSEVNIGVVEKGKVHEDSATNIEFYDQLNKANQTVSKVVTIQNMGGDSYVRVKIVPVIKNSQDQSLAKSVSLTYTFENGTKWVSDGSGTYYYKQELKAGQTTDVLLKSVTLNEDLPTGYHLELQVLSDAIAARPVENLQTAWGIVDFTAMTPLN